MAEREMMLFSLFFCGASRQLSRCAVWTEPHPIKWPVDKIRSDRQGQAEFSQVRLESGGTATPRQRPQSPAYILTIKEAMDYI